MIGLSLACRLNIKVIGALGLLIVFGHNALTPITFAPDEFGYIIWSILHDQNDLGVIAGLKIRASYPVLPWFGVILLGYFAGPLFADKVSHLKRRKLLFSIACGCFFVLLILRGFNVYGETLPWSVQETLIGSIRSFLNYTKYPPSLHYILITLGIGMLLLAWFDSFKQTNAMTKILEVYGSVPMFAYIVHLYVLLAAYWVLFLVFGATHGDRFGLSTVTEIWLGTVFLALVLYYPSKKFAHYKHKEKRNKPWLSYF